MSSFTRTTTPPYSASPLQAFVTYKQARRAAKGGGVVALVYGALLVLGFVQYAIMAEVGTPSAITHLNLAAIAVMTVLMFLLGWRIWVRPGFWKVMVLLLLALLNLLGAIVQLSVVSLVISGVTLNFYIIALRGALAMKRLQGQAQIQADLDVF
jgi:hypothetical protein